MIKTFLTFLLIATIPSLVQAYGLEELNNEADKHVASKDIQSAMRQFVKNDLKDCIKQIGATNPEKYFSAVPISMSL